MSTFGRVLMIFVVLVVIVVIASWLVSRHDHRTLGQKVGNAVGQTIDAIPATVSKAADDLSDKSKMAHVGDDLDNNLKDAGDTASSAISKTGAAASVAVSQTSEDIKAAAAKQKEQDRKAGKTNQNN